MRTSSEVIWPVSVDLSHGSSTVLLGLFHPQTISTLATMLSDIIINESHTIPGDRQVRVDHPVFFKNAKN